MEMLTADEVAARLRIDSGTVRNMARLGELPFIRVGSRSMRFVASDVDAWMDSRRGLVVHNRPRAKKDTTIA